MRKLYKSKTTGQVLITDQRVDERDYTLVGPYDKEKKTKKEKKETKKEKKGFLETVFNDQ